MHIFLKPSLFFCFSYVEFWNIRFDIQKRSPIYNVYILNMEYVLFNPDKAHYRDADWVRSTWINESDRSKIVSIPVISDNLTF